MTTDKFDVWMAAVNLEIRALTGLEADDMPDYLYHDSYDECDTPAEAARDAIRAARDSWPCHA